MNLRFFRERNPNAPIHRTVLEIDENRWAGYGDSELAADQNLIEILGRNLHICQLAADTYERALAIDRVGRIR